MQMQTFPVLDGLVQVTNQLVFSAQHHFQTTKVLVELVQVVAVLGGHFEQLATFGLPSLQVLVDALLVRFARVDVLREFGRTEGFTHCDHFGQYFVQFVTEGLGQWGSLHKDRLFGGHGMCFSNHVVYSLLEVVYLVLAGLFLPGDFIFHLVF